MRAGTSWSISNEEVARSTQKMLVAKVTYDARRFFACRSKRRPKSSAVLSRVFGEFWKTMKVVIQNSQRRSSSLRRGCCDSDCDVLVFSAGLRSLRLLQRECHLADTGRNVERGHPPFRRGPFFREKQPISRSVKIARVPRQTSPVSLNLGIFVSASSRQSEAFGALMGLGGATTH